MRKSFEELKNTPNSAESNIEPSSSQFDPIIYVELYNIERDKYSRLKKLFKKFEEESREEKQAIYQRLNNAEIMVKLLETLLKVSSSNLPRESNYHNTYNVAMESIYLPEENAWKVPKFKVDKQTLPNIAQDDIDFKELVRQNQLSRSRMSLENAECDIL